MQQPPLSYSKCGSTSESNQEATVWEDIICSEFIRATQHLTDHHLNCRAQILCYTPLCAPERSMNTHHSRGEAVTQISKPWANLPYFCVPGTAGPRTVGKNKALRYIHIINALVPQLGTKLCSLNTCIRN